ncbi:post-GPI attachment to proteins factor 3 [Leptopilina heterotoma]|uniref:post-GPI attachment to proteins factor 3 n=1 Tax=Leptopilina heterotoma TaxID=63436 RepID=UPI001CA9CB58|nr:post-GPI attachment to proteins factor 3 [Leptopilina heterotoma]
MFWFLSVLFIVFSNFIIITISSSGDRSQYYVVCVSNCNSKSCQIDGEYRRYPSLELRLLNWSCRDNCSYDCMWKTVTYFNKYGFEVPQFHGKWPFIRILGVQEPASTLFSVFNLYEHVTEYLKFKKELEFSDPMVYVWTYFFLICTNSWLWSTIFHAKDEYFTEVMDYSCAFTTVLTLFYCFLLRISYQDSWNMKIFFATTCAYAGILSMHLSHLWSGSIDYGYNMKFNVAIGFITFVVTMIWWYRNRQKMSHVYLIGWFTILTVTATLLEVLDFPPIFWTFDAHSLWHAATAPLVSLFYRFIRLDCFYLKNRYVKLDLNHLL